MTTQQRTALDKANWHRTMQADLKRELRGLGMAEGKRVAVAVIREPVPEFGSMKVETLLSAVHRLGPGKASAVCRLSRVLPFRRLIDLTPGERERLESVLL